MKKFKKILAGIFAAVAVVSCVAVPTSAEGEISLRSGQAAAVTSIIGAPGVSFWGQCESTSGSSVVFTLRYASGSSMLTAKSFTLSRGRYYEDSVSGYASTTMWQYRVQPINSYNLVGVAKGAAYPMY